MSLLRRVVGNLYHGVKTIGRYVSPVAKFIGKYHQPLTQVAHGISHATGNETAMKVTGAALALSNAVAVRQGLNAANQKVADATVANGNKGGVFNHMTGSFN